jgi:hypothetical protein
MAKKRQTYDDRARQFVQAVDIIQNVCSPSSRFSDEQKTMISKGFAEFQRMALNPEPPFRRIASLRYLEEEVLSGWYNATGPDADSIWSQIREQGLPYQRKDILATVLKRRRIKDQHEFDYITDSIVLAQQDGRITKEQALELDSLLIKFQGL